MALAVQTSFEDLGTPLSPVTFVVVDVETTGGSPATSSLTEVAAARYRGGERIGTYQTLVRPDERIPPFITALTGISDAMVVDAPPIGAMLPSFLEFLGGAVVVGHNIRFDLGFLNQALVATGRDPIANPSVDTLALARRLVRDMVPNCKLGTLAAVLRLQNQPSHRALNDVLATGDLLHALLERAGSYGIVGLEELLDLPRLVGHPQADKLRLTTRLPHRPGVYWFTDAAGHVLYVGKATDIQSRVRSYFTGDRRPKVGRLLRQLYAIHHRVCPGPFTASVMEGRMIRAWSPPYNRQGRARRPRSVALAGLTKTGSGAGRRRKSRRGRIESRVDIAADPTSLLHPLMQEVATHAAAQRYEEAAAVRDDAIRLRNAIVKHRRTESLRGTGHLVLEICGEGTVELHDGVFVECGVLVPDSMMPGGTADEDQDRAVAAQWLHLHAALVRVVHSEHPLCWPAVRIPELTDLVLTTRERESSMPSSSVLSWPVGPTIL
ncbi:MAG TPA: exonuclease domain-containing protein [Acidimicrobiales bacterium]|nr:exonuclease domain-containing protein [Acidimicrobiales bacterium]